VNKLNPPPRPLGARKGHIKLAMALQASNVWKWDVNIPPTNKRNAEQCRAMAICSVHFVLSTDPESPLMH